MAKVNKSANGYEFSNLSGIGMRLVNEFQRCNPELCRPSSNPTYRFVRFGSPERNVLLERLVADVRRLDPDVTLPLFRHPTRTLHRRA